MYTLIMFVFFSKVDFPGVTVCNLNRVNCHNAFMTNYNLTQMLSWSSLSDEEKVVFCTMKPLRQFHFQAAINRTLSLSTILLSDEVTNCLYPVCQQIDQELGEFISTNKDEYVHFVRRFHENEFIHSILITST